MTQLGEALERGLAEARAHNVAFTDASPADQSRFEALYLHDAEANAGAMAQMGIDGLTAFRAARRSVRPDGSVACGGQ